MYKILIVEDDPVIARLVAEQLERWGYEAVPPADPLELRGDLCAGI